MRSLGDLFITMALSCLGESSQRDVALPAIAIYSMLYYNHKPCFYPRLRIFGITGLSVDPLNYQGVFRVKYSFSCSVNILERMKNLTPRGISREKLLPRPGVTSSVSWVCFQYSN